MKILSYAYHGGYEYELAKCGHDFTRICSETEKCNFGSRPHPKNITCVDDLPDYHDFDLFFCNNTKVYNQTKEWDIPRVVAIQCHLTKRDRKILKNVPPHIPVVYISHTCLAQSGGINGFVIYHSIDTEEWKGYNGEESHVLLVANNAETRPECHFDKFLKVTGDMKWRLVGNNPKTPGAFPAKDMEELKEIYRRARVYFNTVEAPLTMGMLEAMATGIPALSLPYGDAPLVIKNGVNGFVSADLNFLREKLQLLLSDRDLAYGMGAEARNTVKKLFSPKVFQERWNHVFELAVANFKNRHLIRKKQHEKKRKKFPWFK